MTNFSCNFSFLLGNLPQIIEKRRRDRINSSLSELRRLVPTAFEKQVRVCVSPWCPPVRAAGFGVQPPERGSLRVWGTAPRTGKCGAKLCLSHHPHSRE